MPSIQNNRKADILFQSDSGESFNMRPGINHGVPEWVGSLKYAVDLHKAGEILAIEGMALPVAIVDDEDDVSRYQLDEDGRPVQAEDENGDLVFDEDGNPVYVLADKE